MQSKLKISTFVFRSINKISEAKFRIAEVIEKLNILSDKLQLRPRHFLVFIS